MLDFHPATINDFDWASPILASSGLRGAEYSFANCLAWHRLSGSHICRYRDFFLCRAQLNDKTAFLFPAGVGAPDAALDVLEQYCAESRIPFILCGVTEMSLPYLKERYGERISITPNRNAADYLYRAGDLIGLEGRKYHAKRNFLKRFLALDYEYLPLSEQYFDDCIKLAAIEYNDSPDSKKSAYEQLAIYTLFENYSRLQLSGGLIKVKGKLVAFTIASHINPMLLDIHIEKATHDYDGAFPAINNLFLTHSCNGNETINREDDLGLDGLRKSKLSYHPIELLTKSILEINI